MCQHSLEMLHGLTRLSASLPGPHIKRITQTQLRRSLSQLQTPALIRPHRLKRPRPFRRIVKAHHSRIPSPDASPQANLLPGRHLPKSWGNIPSVRTFPISYPRDIIEELRQARCRVLTSFFGPWYSPTPKVLGSWERRRVIWPRSLQMLPIPRSSSDHPRPRAGRRTDLPHHRCPVTRGVN